MVNQNLEKRANFFLNLQVLVQKENRREISYINQKSFEEFKKTRKNFFIERYHYLAQKSILNFMFDNIFESIGNEFAFQLNNLTKNILQKNNIKEEIKDCFMIKYREFENKLRPFKYFFRD